MDNFPDRVTEFVSASIRTLIDEGLEVTEQSAHHLKLNINSGYINTRLNLLHMTPDNSLTKIFCTSNYGFVPDTLNSYSPQDTVNTTHWNDITKPYGQSMIEMTAGYWKKDMVAILPNGNVFYVYGQEEFLTSVAAKAAPMQYIPPTTAIAFVFLAFIVCRKSDTSIADRLIDIRPFFQRIWGLLGDTADTRPANASINMMSTGLLNGGILSINAIDPTTFDLSAGNALIVDNTDILNPIYKTVNWDTFTGIPDIHLLTNDTTYVTITELGTIAFHLAELTAEERRDYIEIGWMDHPGRAEIEFAKTEPYYNAGLQSQFNDFIESYSPFNISGNEYTFSTGLTIQREEGSVFDGNSNYSTTTKSPHIINTPYLNPVDINYYHRNGTGGSWVNNLAPVSTIDPDNYDKNGVLTLVPTNRWTIQVIMFYPTYQSNDIQYGQATYNTYKEALSNLYTIIELNPYNVGDVFRTWLIVKQGASDLSDSAQAVFITAGRLRLNEVIGGIQNDQAVIETQSTGQITGGYVTPIGGIHFNVSAGSGYITDNATHYTRVTWEAATNLSTVVDGENFVMVDIDGLVFVTGVIDNYYNYIQIAIMFSGGGNTQLVEVINSPRSVKDFPQKTMRYQQLAVKAIIGYGFEVTERANPNFLELSIAAGNVFMNFNEYIYGITSTFTRMYLTSDYGWVPFTTPPLNTLVPSIYNDITKHYGSALVPLTAGYWKKDLIFRTIAGHVFVICGQTEYATKELALNAGLPSLPTQLDAVAVYLCVVVCQKEDLTIADRIVDIRPQFSRVFQDTTNINKVPTGGTKGQRLAKLSASDYELEWLTDIAAGSAQEIQFNTSNGFDADANLKFDKSNKALLVNGATTANNTPIAASGDVDSAVKVILQNINAGIDASTEFRAVSDTSNSYTTVGSNSSNYADPLETLWKADDSFLEAVGGDLTVGTATAGKKIILHTGGVQSTNIRGEVDDSGVNLAAGNSFRVNNFDVMNIITTAANAVEEAAAFAAGSKIVIRTDLL